MTDVHEVLVLFSFMRLFDKYFTFDCISFYFIFQLLLRTVEIGQDDNSMVCGNGLGANVL